MLNGASCNRQHGWRNVQSGHGKLMGVIPTPFASHAPLGQVALKRCRSGTFGDPRLLRVSIRSSHKQCAVMARGGERVEEAGPGRN